MKIYKHCSFKCLTFDTWFQRTFCCLPLFFTLYYLVGAEILTNVTTVSSSFQVDINFNEASLDQASLAYHLIFKTNDSSLLVLNITTFSTVDDNGGAKILVASENLYDDDYPNRPLPSIDDWQWWKIYTWSGPCAGGSLLTSNNTQIHVVIYQLVRLARFTLKGAVCTFQPCIPRNPVDSKSKRNSSAPAPKICLPAQIQSSSTNSRAFHSLLPFNNCYYAFGGLASLSPFDDLPPFYTLVSQTNCGKSLLRENQFPISRRYLATIISGPSGSSRIFFLGGIGSDFSPVSSGDGYLSYNFSVSSSSSWFSMPALRLFGHAACAFSDSRIYIYGGSTFNGAISSSLLQWRQKWSAWKEVVAWYGSAPPPLVGHSLTCSSDSMKLYLYGGFSLTSSARLNPNPTVFVFDLIVKRWSTLVTTEPRFFHSAALLPAKINGGDELASRTVLAIVGGMQSSNDVLLVDTRCQIVSKAEFSTPLQSSARSGVATAVESLQAEPYFRLLISGGLNETSISSATPTDMKMKLPIISRRCPKNAQKDSDNPLPYWRCGLAINPAVYFNTNTSRYYYDVYLSPRNDLTTYVDIDALANMLSSLTSPSVEWVVQCHGWLRLDSMTGVSIAATSDDGTVVDRRNLNFRFAIYLFIDGNLIQSYQPSGAMQTPSLPLMDPDDGANRGNIGNGIFQVTVFLHGLGPIVPSGSNLQLQSSTTGATYLLPSSMLSQAVAELACSSPSSQTSCVACLLNAACSWLPGWPGMCVARRLEMPTSEMGDDDVRGDVIRDPAACPSCFTHSTYCHECVSSVGNTCAWLPDPGICASQTVTLQIPEADTTCSAKPCFSRDTCSSCTAEHEGTSPQCLWCPQRGVCVDYWMVEAGLQTAMGCTLGCQLPTSTLPTTPSPPPTTTICADDNSWCGTPNEICQMMMAASLLETTSTTQSVAVTNPIFAFPQLRDDEDDDSASNVTSGFTEFPPLPFDLNIDPKVMLLRQMDPSQICSGHGHCVPPGRCQCDQFWQGDSCTRECRCYGDAKCPDPTRPDVCACPAGTTGQSCDRCITGYTGSPRNGNPCRSCRTACNNNADMCVSLTAVKQFNLTDALPSMILSRKLPVPEQDSDIFCIGCRDNTMGNLCGNCLGGFFRPAFLGRIDNQAKCQACMCNGHGNTCNEAGGFGCRCEDNTQTAYAVPNTLGCALCIPPFVGDPRNGRPCYLPVSQNQQLCLWQDSVPGLAARLLAAVNSSDPSNLCRHSRDSNLPSLTSMHIASQVPLASELRIFIGVVTGKIDIVMTLNPSSLRPAPKTSTRNSRKKRAVVFQSKMSSNSYATYDNIVEISQIQNAKNDPNGNSIVYISRTQLIGAPIAIRGVTGRFLIVILPPNDRLKQGDELDDSDSIASANQPIVFYLRITAVSQTSLRVKNINEDSYYSVGASDPTVQPAAGVVVFRQDQVQIDVFVFFSVFLALFVLLLLGLLLVIRFHAVLSERRRMRARQQRKRAMIRRPLGVSWPRFDVPLLLNQVTKTPMKLSDMLLPNATSDTLVLPQNQQQKQQQGQTTRKTATIVLLQPTSDLRAAISTVLIKLPVTRPVTQRQVSTASGFNVNELTAIVTSVPPPPMAFGTLIMRVIVTEQKKVPSGRRARLVSPVKPGRQPLFDRDPTDESFVEEPYPAMVTPSPVVVGTVVGSVVVPPIRLNTRSSISQRQNTQSSVTLPPTPDTVVSTREGGDELDLEDMIDEIMGSTTPTNNAPRRVAQPPRRPLGAGGRGGLNPRSRPMAAANNRPRVGVGANSTGRTLASSPGPASPPAPAPAHRIAPPLAPRPPVFPAQQQVSRDVTESTIAFGTSIPATGRNETDSVLIPELPDGHGRNNRRGGGVFNRATRPVAAAPAVLAQRPPLPPAALAASRLGTAIGRRQSVPSAQQRRSARRRLNNMHVNAPNSVHSEEDSAI